MTNPPDRDRMVRSSFSSRLAALAGKESSPPPVEVRPRASALPPGTLAFAPVVPNAEAEAGSTPVHKIPPELLRDTPLNTPRITLPTSESSSIPMPKTALSQQPVGGRASAQLTLGFEIVSLQLTPFFRLGSVQLKAVSNVVSLHLVTADPSTGPFAAGVSFRIEKVDLASGSQLKGIVLRPLGESREVASPVSHLAVGTVELVNANAAAPITVAAGTTKPTTVQFVGTFAVAAMEFTPAFEIDTLRVEPTADTVLLRVSAAGESNGGSLPSKFTIAALDLDGDGRVEGARLVPAA